ncbi:MAG: hypothetical protein AAF944_21470 [Bacteroidota bacterium]
MKTQYKRTMISGDLMVELTWIEQIGKWIEHWTQKPFFGLSSIAAN